MGRRRKEKSDIRKIQQSNGSYYVTLPIEVVRELDWQERQKVRVRKYGSDKIIIEDWKE